MLKGDGNGMKDIFSTYWLNRKDEYRLPPRITFGYGAIGQTGDVALQLSKNKDVIIITDKFLQTSGIVDE
ncbi:MAG: hypothetical protein ACP5GW_03250, partial [Caldisericaceae bacterium]